MEELYEDHPVRQQAPGKIGDLVKVDKKPRIPEQRPWMVCRNANYQTWEAHARPLAGAATGAARPLEGAGVETTLHRWRDKQRMQPGPWRVQQRMQPGPWRVRELKPLSIVGGPGH